MDGLGYMTVDEYASPKDSLLGWSFTFAFPGGYAWTFLLSSGTQCMVRCFMMFHDVPISARL